MFPRLLKVGKTLKAGKADAFLVVNSEKSSQPGTEYLSGFTGSSSILLITAKKKVLITDSRYTEQAREQGKGFEIIILKPDESLSAVLKCFAEKLCLKKILIDGNITSYSSVENIKKAIPEIKIISKNGILQELRVVKDKHEITSLKKAAEIASLAFIKFLPEVKADVSEKMLAPAHRTKNFKKENW
ncbi:MAG: Xaa-Pro dipeptidase [candidate division CPR1 bacterium GW2011_GWA2_42_17]|uniref:Xaa-Pro dipeptidase n=1 Tax=candidate division CPR1 bacterium GW2011_GWA2_42_17 TaxID=1618341 RepID=A0A0G1BBA2_9BACT|nr:MAG: Xaa-Pro dipeptidase [candidate division CPR1 bacterium GW2011_GWA2_42_17]